MTNPVILLGTQSNGETLPVQVDAFGRLVAEGLQGPEGPEGPPGEDGPPGGSFPLPPDPYEGALLGWLNNGLAWVGAPPVPIPPGVFGPIESWDPNSGVITVEGDIPAEVGNGVYLWQCNEDGTLYTEGADVSQIWSNYGSGTPWNVDRNWDKAFNNVRENDLNVTFAANNGTMTWEFDIPVVSDLQFNCLNTSDQSTYGLRVNGSLWFPTTATYDAYVSATSEQVGGRLTRIELINASTSGPYLMGVRVDGKWLIDPGYSLSFRVQQVVGNMLIGSLENGPTNFTPGKYLKVPSQRVAPWVLYGNDPTSLIDHLRSS